MRRGAPAPATAELPTDTCDTTSHSSFTTFAGMTLLKRFGTNVAADERESLQVCPCYLLAFPLYNAAPVVGAEIPVSEV